MEAQLEVYEGQSHAQYIPDPSVPETEEAFGEITKFFDTHLAHGDAWPVADSEAILSGVILLSSIA